MSKYLYLLSPKNLVIERPGTGSGPVWIHIQSASWILICVEILSWIRIKQNKMGFETLPVVGRDISLPANHVPVAIKIIL